MASIPKVLLVEDDKNVSDTLVLALANEYEVDVASTGKSAIYKSDYIDYDQIILDLYLPDMSGIGVCAELRARGLRAPILILSGSADVATKINLLDLGASDYLTKPFALGELKARLRVLARRKLVIPASNPKLEVYGVILDRRTLNVTRSNIPIVLRRKEFELLATLMECPGQVVSRTELVNAVWPGSDTIWTNTVDVHINHLRDKLDKPFSSPLIHTVHGKGYKIEELKIEAIL